MYSLVYRILVWLAQKLAIAVLIVVLGLAAYGGWMFVQDSIGDESRRAAAIAGLTRARDTLRQGLAELEAEAEALQQDVALQRYRAEEAAKIMTALGELSDWWDWLFGSAEQRQTNEERRARLEKLQRDSLGRLIELEQLVVRNHRTRTSTAAELEETERALRVATEQGSGPAFYVREAWLQTRWWILIALLGFFFGPTLMKLFNFYVLAPMVSNGRPILLADKPGPMPVVEPSRVSVEAALWPGELVRVKEKYLHASDEGLQKRTRFVLDWRIPFTSAACGLIELVELRNSQAGGELRVTFSDAADPHVELAIVSVPHGGALVLRPSFLAGVIGAADTRLRIKRRWQLLRWQSWVTLQFRFFEFRGPCRLLVAGSRGVRAEVLDRREGHVQPARRTNQRATIGFTPGLSARPVRAETFWSYYRGMNPLFDDLFSGKGVFIVQETATEGEEGKAGNFWSTIWSGVLKVFGL